MISPSPMFYDINGNALLCGRLDGYDGADGSAGVKRLGVTSQPMKPPSLVGFESGSCPSKRLQRFAPQVGETYGAMSDLLGRVRT